MRRNLPQLLGEIEHLWDEKGRAHLWAFHDVPHRYSNQILHSTATAAGATTIGATSEALHLTLGPSNQLVPQALMAGYWIYGQVFSLLIDVFRLKADEYREISEAGWATFSAGATA